MNSDRMSGVVIPFPRVARARPLRRASYMPVAPRPNLDSVWAALHAGADVLFVAAMFAAGGVYAAVLLTMFGYRL